MAKCRFFLRLGDYPDDTDAGTGVVRGVYL
jgi:hypothetical protein